MTTLVIGGNSGIGAEFVRYDQIHTQFAEHVWLVPSIEDLDVSSDDSVNYWFPKRSRRQEERINRVVYCAGVNHPAMLGDLDGDDVVDTFNVNVVGFIRLVDALVRWNRPGPCSIVAVVSDAATVAMRGSISYCASKAALAQAIRCAAREMADKGWRVNGIAPSMVNDTPMTDKIDKLIPAIRHWTTEQAREYEMLMNPMKRRCTKREVAALITEVLLGPQFLNGAVIPLTGGK